ncbi:DUF805 domain-containing protein [Pseudomonas sp. NyZ201]|uniref:DUF805 domain-containing protein n=1 Tax=Pseudomonas sp. NyZ201 TaxID=3409857 RepID=UPI003CEF7486
MSCWIRLGIEPTKDQNTIRGAYRARLPEHHPETDPEGFQALREAYESALRHAREEPQTPREEPAAAAAPGILDEFRALLEDSTRRYDPPAWQAFVRQLDQLPLETLEDVSWSLLQGVRSCGMISRECVRILAKRLAWSQQLLRLDFEAAREIEGFLDHLEQPDPFPTGLMGQWSAIAQQETLWYLNSLEYLFHQRPLFEYASFANLHTCLPLPADDALIQRLMVQFAIAEVPSPSLYERCAGQQAADPENIDLLFLLAQHATILERIPEALSSWAMLHWQFHHPQAPRRLIELCHGQQPQFVPLLIQAFDRQQDVDAWPQGLEEQGQLFGSFAQSPETLSRWYIARRTEPDGLAAAFVNWRLDDECETNLLALLLDDHPQPALQRLYRYAWGLSRGNERLLREISEAPVSTDLYEELVLREFRRQAAQRLRWLAEAPVPLALGGYLASEERYPDFPRPLGKEFGPLACRNWLRHMRAFDQRALYRVFEQFAPRQMYPRPFALDHQARLAKRGLELPPEDDMAPAWTWHAQGLFILALLEKPERWLGLISPSMLRNLDYPAGHPFAATRDLLGQWLASGTPVEALLSQLDHANPVQALLADELCTLDSVMAGEHLPRPALLIKTFANDREAFAGDRYSMTLFLGALFLDPELSDEDRGYLLEQMKSVADDDPWCEKFRQYLPKRKIQRPARKVLERQGIDGDAFYLALDALEKMAAVDSAWPASRALATLQMSKDDPANGNGLRLALTAVLALAERLMALKTPVTAVAPWQFWRIDRRLGRRSYGLMMGLCAGLLASIALMPSELHVLAALFFIGAGLGTWVRRLRDREQPLWLWIAMVIFPVLIPLYMLALLVLPSDVLPNRFGRPGDGQAAPTGGLQALLRQLKPKRRARPASVLEPGDGW